MSDEIKCCPFCGSDCLYIIAIRGYLDDTLGIFCNSCKATVTIEENDQEGFTNEAQERAIKAWNRRADK